MKAKIEAGGRTVEIEDDDQADAKALALWHKTADAEPSEGPGFGFAQERRWSAATSPMSMGGYGDGYMTDPVASTVDGPR